MKASRLVLAAITVTIASACSGADLTGPSAVDALPSFQTEGRGTLGSGDGRTQGTSDFGDGGIEEATPQGTLGSGDGRGTLGSGDGRI
jgi:hypothetical protein